MQVFVFTSLNIFQTGWPISARVCRDHQGINDVPTSFMKSHKPIVSPQLRETLLGECNPSRHLRIHWRQSFPKKKLYSSLDTSFETQVCGKPRALWAGTQSDAFGGHFSFPPLHLIWQPLTVSSRLVWSAHIVLDFPLNIKVHSLKSAVSIFCTFTCKERNSGGSSSNRFCRGIWKRKQSTQAVHNPKGAATDLHVQTDIWQGKQPLPSAVPFLNYTQNTLAPHYRCVNNIIDSL